MDQDSYSENPAKSQTWFKRGLSNITRIGRSSTPAITPAPPNPLRDIFTDMIAYIIFFEASCSQQPPSASDLRAKVLALANAQEERAKNIGVAVETFREARFAVLAWADETILNSNWPPRMQWQHLMLSYYGTLNAGEEFFRHLELLAPAANDVREIYYLALTLGFEGRYAFGDNSHELRDLIQRLYKQLSSGSGDIRQSYARLFPEAYQRIAAAPAAPKRTSLVWYIAVSSIPLLLFFGFGFLLWNESNRLVGMIRTTLPPKPPPDCLMERLRQKDIPAKDTSRGLMITLEGLLFDVNSIHLSGRAQTRIDDLVDIVKGCARDRNIVVEGHASMEKSVNEARNLELSEGRARTVAGAFRASGFPQEQIAARGFGSSTPIADNNTEGGRAKNRRVEIIVRK